MHVVICITGCNNELIKPHCQCHTAVIHRPRYWAVERDHWSEIFTSRRWKCKPRTKLTLDSTDRFSLLVSRSAAPVWPGQAPSPVSAGSRPLAGNTGPGPATGDVTATWRGAGRGGQSVRDSWAMEQCEQRRGESLDITGATASIAHWGAEEWEEWGGSGGHHHQWPWGQEEAGDNTAAQWTARLDHSQQ